MLVRAIAITRGAENASFFEIPSLLFSMVKGCGILFTVFLKKLNLNGFLKSSSIPKQKILVKFPTIFVAKKYLFINLSTAL